jgi:beta-phosphoglucomutase family hydrolase
MISGPEPSPLDRARFDAILFDLDGVLTETASTHRIAWKAMFDEYLESRSRVLDENFREFTPDDYLRYVDGKPRFDGVRTFLTSRGISLPEGGPGDSASTETVRGLGTRKNEAFNRLLDKGGVTPLPGALRFVNEARRLGIRTAVVSSSANAERVLSAGGITHLFDVRVDGLVARDLNLVGKPAPDTFLEAARRLDTPPDRAVVVEDALVGVEAGRAGGFGLVIGIGGPAMDGALREHGADLVVADLGELLRD